MCNASGLMLVSALVIMGAAQQLQLPVPVVSRESGDIAASYVLGPDDQVVIRALNVQEFDGRPARIDLRGYVDTPLVGSIKAGGLTVEQLQSELTRYLSKYLNEPNISVTVSEYRSQPVSIIGAVNKPGIYHLTGGNTLLQLIAQAGGLSNDAGNTIEITRRKAWGPIPLASTRRDSTGEFTTAQLNHRAMLKARIPEQDIVLRPNDVISVPRAELVYVLGAVRKPGGFVLAEREEMSVLQALALAEGLDKGSSPSRAKIIRQGDDDRKEIVADIKRILAGRSLDIPLQPNDILFIPTSQAKNATLRGIEAAIQIGTGVVIWR